MCDMNPSAKSAANAIIKHYKKRGISLNQACKYAVIDLRFVCNFKTLYHISRGQNTSPRVEYELRKLHRTITASPLSTDFRPRLATQFATDEDKDLVKTKLTNDERRDLLYKEAKEKQ